MNANVGLLLTKVAVGFLLLYVLYSLVMVLPLFQLS